MGFINFYVLMEFIYRSIGFFMIYCYKFILLFNRRKKKKVISNKVKEERVVYVLNFFLKLFDKIIF